MASILTFMRIDRQEKEAEIANILNYVIYSISFFILFVDGLKFGFLHWSDLSGFPWYVSELDISLHSSFAYERHEVSWNFLILYTEFVWE